MCCCMRRFEGEGAGGRGRLKYCRYKFVYI